MNAPLWKPGDRVRFAHQYPDGPIHVVSVVHPLADHVADKDRSMVELEDMSGQFVDYIFVRARDFEAESRRRPGGDDEKRSS